MGQPSISARQNASTRIPGRVWCRRVIIPGLMRKALKLVQVEEVLYG
jgi:hypothetical protein